MLAVTKVKISSSEKKLSEQEHSMKCVTRTFLGGCLYTEPGLENFSLSRHFHLLQVT